MQDRRSLLPIFRSAGLSALSGSFAVQGPKVKARAYKKQRNRAVTENYANLVPGTRTQTTNIALFWSGQTSCETDHIYDASELHSVTQDYLTLVMQTEVMRPKHAPCKSSGRVSRSDDRFGNIRGDCRHSNFNSLYPWLLV